VHIDRTCSRINCNLFIINRLSKILELNERRILYYGLIYPLPSHGIVCGQSAEVLTRGIFTFQKRSIRYTAGLIQLESCRDSSRHLKKLILKVYSLYIQDIVQSYM
jgi:hypothetical protein